jgi:hypothetical protein
MAPFYTVNGATDAAIREACGGPQRNLLKRVEGMGHKVTTAKVAGPNGRMATVKPRHNSPTSSEAGLLHWTLALKGPPGPIQL